MRKSVLTTIFTLCVLGMAALAWAACPTDYYVDGSTVTGVNGDYASKGILNGKCYFGNASYDLFFATELPYAESWRIADSSNHSNVIFVNVSTATLPPATDWGKTMMSMDIPPIVTPTPLPDSYHVSGSITGADGKYTRGLNWADKPSYQMGDYSLQYAWDDSGWTIVDQTVPETLFGNSAMDIVPPASGWQTTAMIMAVPPLVTETPLPPAYAVSGAGQTEINGIYRRDFNTDDHPSYGKDTFWLYHSPTILMGGAWGITNFSMNEYYFNTNDMAVPPPLTGWSAFSGVPEPAPTLTILGLHGGLAAMFFLLM